MVVKAAAIVVKEVPGCPLAVDVSPSCFLGLMLAGGPSFLALIVGVALAVGVELNDPQN